MGRQRGVGGRVGRGRGAGALGRASDGEDLRAVAPKSPLALATSFEFLRLFLSAGMFKVGLNLLLQFSNFSFDRVSPDCKWSVRGELCIANHKKEEEEEERSGGKLLRREPVLSRLNGLTFIPTKSQAGRTPNVMTNHQMPP